MHIKLLCQEHEAFAVNCVVYVFAGDTTQQQQQQQGLGNMGLSLQMSPDLGSADDPRDPGTDLPNGNMAPGGTMQSASSSN